MRAPEPEPESSSISDQIVTTTFPLDYAAQNQIENVQSENQNSLFDSPEQLEEENVFEKYYKELYDIVPAVKDIIQAKPVSMRPELFLNVIIEKTAKDEKMIQYFKNRSQIEMNNGL